MVAEGLVVAGGRSSLKGVLRQEVMTLCRSLEFFSRRDLSFCSEILAVHGYPRS